MDDLKRKNDAHRFVVADGVGKGLGRIRNKRRSWKKMKERLSEPLRDTSITFAQYKALDPDAKLEKKRAPGSWTPSRYKGNRRLIADLEAKTLIVFDLDYISHEQLADIRMGLAPISQWAWFMHTTRGHFPESPRARMILPISREMAPDEAQAVFRFLAQHLADDPDEAIEIPDLVSFRGNQTMFWPSVCKDQEFWTDENVAPILDVDAILDAHPGWEDFNNLPFQAEESKRGVTDPNRRMEDPHEKPDPIGAFCRAYTVQEVIEKWLGDVYAPGDSESDVRYSYLPGGSANGAVVYEDGKFLHSHHSTDRVETANAFDLLRIHKFGHLDDDAHANTKPGNMPSFKAMQDLAWKDDRVLEEIYSGHDATIDDREDDGGDDGDGGDDIDDLLGPPPKGDDGDDEDDEDDDGEDDDGDGTKPGEKKKKGEHAWIKHLRRRANDDIEPVVSNIALICENDKRLKDCIGYNEFTRDPVCFKPIRATKIDLPSSDVPKKDRKRGRRWEGADDTSIAILASANSERGGYECDFSSEKIQQAVLAAGKHNAINPVKDDIEDCWRRWKAEGAPTGLLDTYVIDFLKTPDTPFHRQTGALFILGSVARTYEPGCKFDQMPIIEGVTGSGKSLFFSVLFLPEYTSEMDDSLDNTGRLIESMRGHRCMELAEMDAAKKAEANTLKRLLSSGSDTFRMAYGRREEDFPRQCVWGGTSNDDDYLTDPTSNRRFWVWRTPLTRKNRIDNYGLEKVRHLIWGEAYQRYLDMREAQPHGSLLLDITDDEVVAEQERINEGSRKRTKTELLADEIRDFLDERVEETEAENINDIIPEKGDETRMMVRNMVTARMVFRKLHSRDHIKDQFPRMDERTYGKALGMISGWTSLGQCHRHGQKKVWFVRDEWAEAALDPELRHSVPLWVDAPGDSDAEIEDMLD